MTANKVPIKVLCLVEMNNVFPVHCPVLFVAEKGKLSKSGAKLLEPGQLGLALRIHRVEL